MGKTENRNNVRIANQVQILNLLRKQKMTVTDLSNCLGISLTATLNIVEELIDEKIIRYVTKSKKGVSRGRIPVYIEMNLDKGVTCAIDFSKRDIQIAIVGLDSNIIVSTTIPNIMFIEHKHLVEIESKIKLLLEDEKVNGRKLLSICISSPGLIRPDNFEYVSVYRIKNFQNMNPVLYFANAFNVKVEMHNDVRTGCLAELKFGSFPKYPFNGMFLHIGTECGSSLIVNGKIFIGSNGFSGETPNYNQVDDISNEMNFNGRFCSIWEILLRIADLKKVQRPSPTDIIDINKLALDFANKDKETLQAVEESCKRNAITIIGLATILDIEYIVIEGSILKIDSSYIEKLRKYISEYSTSDLRTRIMPSTLSNSSSLLGACYQSISIHLFEALETATRKRINSPSFRMDEAFKEMGSNKTNAILEWNNK